MFLGKIQNNSKFKTISKDLKQNVDCCRSQNKMLKFLKDFEKFQDKNEKIFQIPWNS